MKKVLSCCLIAFLTFSLLGVNLFIVTPDGSALTLLPVLPIVATVPAAPSGLACTAKTTTTVNLAWTDNSGNEIGFRVERKTGSTGTWAQVGLTLAANATTYADSGLTAGTTYYYRVKAYNTTGEAVSNEISVTTNTVTKIVTTLPVTTLPGTTLPGTTLPGTLPGTIITPIVTVPAAPSGLVSTAKTVSSVSLSWTDNSTNESGFKVERKLGSTGTWGQVGSTLAANTTVYTDSGLTAGTTYYYRVKAYNTAGESTSGEISVTTNSLAIVLPGTLPGTIKTPITTVPATPTGLVVKSKTSDEITISWTNVSSETGYKIERKTGTAAFAQVGTTAADMTNYTSSGLNPDTAYVFRVRAYNSAGNSAYSSELSVTTDEEAAVQVQIAAPTDLVLEAVSSTEVALTWKDNSNNEDGFKVECKSEGESWAELGTVEANSVGCSNTGINPDTKYYYRVRAYNSTGDSEYSNEAEVTTTGEAPVPVATNLAAPTELAAVAASATEINLSWTDNAENETGYKVERKSGNGSYMELGAVEANVTSCTDTGLDPGTQYFYRVRATDSQGDSEYSNEADATTTADVPVPTGQAEIRLYVGDTGYSVNNSPMQMDAAPIIRGGRTMLPVRYVAEPLGATVNWDSVEQKVTITSATKIIELWINNPVAVINGAAVNIDQSNTSVKPITVPPGRTMLPIRFIAENLDCQVDWNQANQEVKITYPIPQQQ